MAVGKTQLAIAGIMVFVAAIALAIFADQSLTGFASLNAAQEETIKIGVIGPLTGDAAKYGQDIKNAIDIAVEEINNKGGIKGKKIELIYEDSVCEPKKGVTALQKLINADDITIVIDEACSSVALAEAPIAENSKTLLMLASASNYKIKYAGDYVFRVFPSDSFQGKKIAEIINSDGHKRVAIIYLNDDYGLGLKEVFEEEFELLGGTVVAAETHQMGETDFRSILTKIKALQPDAIMLADHYKEAALGMKQLRELKIEAALYASDAIKDNLTIEAAGSAAEGLKVVYAAPPESQVFEEFKASYKSMFGSSPETYAAYGYDAMKLLAKAIEKAGADATKVKEELYKMDSYQGVTGIIGFDSFGERQSASYKVYVVRDGKFVLYEE